MKFLFSEICIKCRQRLKQQLIPLIQKETKLALEDVVFIKIKMDSSINEKYDAIRPLILFNCNNLMFGIFSKKKFTADLVSKMPNYKYQNNILYVSGNFIRNFHMKYSRNIKDGINHKFGSCTSVDLKTDVNQKPVTYDLLLQDQVVKAQPLSGPGQKFSGVQQPPNVNASNKKPKSIEDNNSLQPFLKNQNALITLPIVKTKTLSNNFLWKLNPANWNWNLLIGKIRLWILIVILFSIILIITIVSVLCAKLITPNSTFEGIQILQLSKSGIDSLNILSSGDLYLSQDNGQLYYINDQNISDNLKILGSIPDQVRHMSMNQQGQWYVGTSSGNIYQGQKHSRPSFIANCKNYNGNSIAIDSQNNWYFVDINSNINLGTIDNNAEIIIKKIAVIPGASNLINYGDNNFLVTTTSGEIYRLCKTIDNNYRTDFLTKLSAPIFSLVVENNWTWIALTKDNKLWTGNISEVGNINAKLLVTFPTVVNMMTLNLATSEIIISSLAGTIYKIAKTGELTKLVDLKQKISVLGADFNCNLWYAGTFDGKVYEGTI